MLEDRKLAVVAGLAILSLLLSAYTLLSFQSQSKNEQYYNNTATSSFNLAASAVQSKDFGQFETALTAYHKCVNDAITSLVRCTQVNDSNGPNASVCIPAFGPRIQGCEDNYRFYSGN